MIRVNKLFEAWVPPRPTTKSSATLLTGEQIRRVLDRERMRSDRGTSSFSLLTLSYPTPCDAAELAAIGRWLGTRIRATDDAGQLDAWRLCVVLPETSPDGACKLADDLCELLPPGATRPECDVYTYPRYDETHQPMPHESDRNGAPAHVKTTNGSARPTAGRNGAAKNDAVSGRPARLHSMQAMFIRPLPAWKRVIDVLLAGIAILVFSPLLLLVAVAIKLTSRGPVIFTQKRDTIGGRQFMIFKFRTMTVDAEGKKADLLTLSEQDGPAFKIAKDPRVTWLGRILRVTSIDELPQLINVLLGDMSLVGPRPLPCDESNLCEPWQRRRLDVTAGITCIWQVRGRSAVSFCEWIRMDIEYIRSRSLINDVKLIAQTVPALALRRGAY